ncbi:MAG: translation initiation factor [Candidatus Promineifilaceae bacterium]
MPRKKRNTVYSTDNQEMARIRRRKQDMRRPIPVRSKPPSEQMVRIKRETKGRGGKTVTVLYDLVLSEADMKTLAKRLKQVCGTGGAVKEKEIVIQGDNRDKVSAELTRQGYKFKFAGG